ncbi:MAG TPA: HdeD family acid-resistance protein [Xanthobacteraceae bacterium]|nr:HdeD family acid-resistance protein [Xanthobacteraceae bacterium]
MLNNGSQAPDARGVLREQITAEVARHWKAYLAEGIVIMLLGLAAVVVPPLASIAVTLFLAWLFIVMGIAGIIFAFWARNAPGFWWSLISAVVAVIAGVVLLLRPIAGTLTLTIIVGAFLLVEGVTTIMYALEHRKSLSERWGWMVASGVCNLIIAAFIILGLPGSALWAIGLLVGIDLLFTGATLIGLAMSARKYAV